MTSFTLLAAVPGRWEAKPCLQSRQLKASVTAAALLGGRRHGPFQAAGRPRPELTGTRPAALLGAFEASPTSKALLPKNGRLDRDWRWTGTGDGQGVQRERESCVAQSVWGRRTHVGRSGARKRSLPGYQQLWDRGQGGRDAAKAGTEGDNPSIRLSPKAFRASPTLAVAPASATRRSLQLGRGDKLMDVH